MADSLKAKTISSLFWKLFERGGKAIIELVVQIVMARLLTPGDFGSIAIMLVFVNIGSVLVQSGLNTALVQAEKVDNDSFSTVFWMSLCVSIVLYAVAFFLSPAIADYYENQALTWPLRVLCIVLLVNAYNAVQVAKVTRELQMRKIFTATILSVLVSGALGVASAVAGAGLWALVIQQLSFQLTSCVVLAFQVDWKPRFTFRVSEAKELFSFGWKLLVSGLIDTGYRSLADLIIGKHFSVVDLGYVSQGQKYPQALGTMLDGAIQPVMLSAVSHVQNDIAYVKRLVRRALKTSTYVVMPAMTLFAVVAEPLVCLLLGERWLPCVPFLQIYCFTNALLPIHSTNLQALNGMGRSDLFLKLEIIKKIYGLANLLFCAFVLQNIQLLVASYMITGIVSTFVNAYPNKKVIGYAYFEQVRDIGPSVLLSLLSGAIAMPISMLAIPDIAIIALQSIVMVFTYVLLSKLFRVEAFGYLLDTGKSLLLTKGRESEG